MTRRATRDPRFAPTRAPAVSAVALWALLPLLIALAGCSGSSDVAPEGDGVVRGDAWPADGGDVAVGADGEDTGSEWQDPYAVVEVLPAEGSAFGGDVVAVLGRGFVDGVRVWFGDEPGTDIQVVAQGYLETRTPPGPVGPVSVRVRWPNGVEAVLDDAFTYEKDVRVTSITPAEGSVEGGTPVIVKGEGFSAETRLVIGGRQAAEVRLSDANTLVALTPPAAEAGAADVIAGGAEGFGVLEGGFTYRERLRIDVISPVHGPVAGGDAVTIDGAGFGPDPTVFFGPARADVVAIEDSRIVVTAPPGEVGAVDVAIANEWSTAAAVGGYVYTVPGGEQTQLALLGVVPSEGAAAGGEDVTLVAHGLQGVGPGAVEVSFGGRAADVRGVGTYDVRVTTPAGEAGPVDVTLVTPDGESTLVDAFRYRAPFAVDAVSPGFGGTGGGTEITVTGVGFSEGVREVRVGALAASGLRVVDDGELRALTPPGAAGRTDVVVRRDDTSARLVGGFEYRAEGLGVYAVVPAEGAVGGGTRVEVFGAGFGPGVTVLFGGEVADVLETVDDGHLIVSTPANPSGTVNVEIRRDSLAASLPGGFTYFDPETGSGGTWGDPIEGSVNVVVMDIYRQTPVDGAWVVLGEDPAASMSGRTDEEGRITFSAPSIVGPQKVSAGHPEYSAASVIVFDASNVTLLLFPKNPPTDGGGSGGGGGGIVNLSPGFVSGQVIWDDKYRLIPYGNCNVLDPVGVQCLACAADEDCGGEARCTRIEQTGKFCTLPCASPSLLEPNPEACPEGHTCAYLASEGYRCVPTPGDVVIRCETTSLNPDTVPPSPGPGALVGPDMRYELTTRLEELAVVCVASQTLQPLGPSVPFLMGVRRHIQTMSATELENQDVVLDIPLRSQLRVRLGAVPTHPMGVDRWAVKAWLDFGAEGTYQLRSSAEGGRGQGDYVLTEMPPGLGAGTLAGASLRLQAEQWSAIDFEDLHRGQTIMGGVTDLDDDSLLRWDGEAWGVEELGSTFEFRALAEGPEGALFAVGDTGRIARREGGRWYSEASPVKAVLTDIWADGPERSWATGQDGVVLERTERGWRLREEVPGFDWFAVHGASGEHPIIAGDRGQLGRLTGDAWEPIDAATTEALRAVLVLAPGEAWVAGDAGVVRHIGDDGVTAHDLPDPVAVNALAADAHGAPLAFTASGAIYRWDAPDDGEAGWALEDSGATVPLYGAAANPAGALVAVGDDGTVLERGADGVWQFIGQPGYRADLRAVLATSDGAMFAGGLHNLIVSPILSVPRFKSIRGLDSLAGVPLEWTVSPEGQSPSIQHITILTWMGFPVWDVYLEAHETSVILPDFTEMASFDPLSISDLVIRIDRIYHPAIDIDRFTFMDLWTNGSWPAVTTATTLFDME